LIERVHAKGRRLRLWGAPDTADTWSQLLAAGVDRINTDDLRVAGTIWWYMNCGQYSLDEQHSVIEQLAAWSREGSLVFREDIEAGLDRAPAALAGLFRGENRGKKIIQVYDGANLL